MDWNRNLKHRSTMYLLFLCCPFHVFSLLYSLRKVSKMRSKTKYSDVYNRETHYSRCCCPSAGSVWHRRTEQSTGSMCVLCASAPVCHWMPGTVILLKNLNWIRMGSLIFPYNQRCEANHMCCSLLCKTLSNIAKDPSLHSLLKLCPKLSDICRREQSCSDVSVGANRQHWQRPNRSALDLNLEPIHCQYIRYCFPNTHSDRVSKAMLQKVFGFEAHRCVKCIHTNKHFVYYFT